MKTRPAPLALALLLAVAPAFAWDSNGHRAVTYLALDGLPADAPAWLLDPDMRQRIAYQASEPDRWRSWPSPILGHENKPEHYVDLEDLPPFGLTLATNPHFRMEYIRALVIAKHEHPDKLPPYDAAKDADHSTEFPGQLQYGIAEEYAKLCASFNQLRILMALNDPERKNQLAQMQANVTYHMGILSHYIADGAQPLHTTKHHHGWVGENPGKYTTSTKIHSYIDGEVLRKHNLSYATLRPGAHFDIQLNAADTWDDVNRFIERSHSKVEELYKLERDGELDKETGKKFITERLTDAGAMLAALYSAAWTNSAPTDKQLSDYKFYDGKFEPPPAAQPAHSAMPASSPAKHD